MNQTPMPLYVGTKRLYAQPMTLGAYNAYRGWTMPEGEDPAAPGYLVEYVDGGKANDSRHAGYISWSPADVFERTYKLVPTDTTIEAEIQAKASAAPRVTPADIDAAIISEHYFTAGDGVVGVQAVQDAAGAQLGDMVRVGTKEVPGELELLTFCVLVLRNGFNVTGTSACASPENFDAGIGRKVARADAVRQVWPLLGYALREKLAAKPTDWRDRVLQERAELAERLDKLTAFLADPKGFLGNAADLELLRAQAAAMKDYLGILDERIERFPGAESYGGAAG